MIVPSKFQQSREAPHQEVAIVAISVESGFIFYKLMEWTHHSASKILCGMNSTIWPCAIRKVRNFDCLELNSVEHNKLIL